MSVVAITGGAQGIGRAIAIRFAEEGYDISIADTHEQAGLESRDLIGELGGKSMFTCVDIANEAEVERWMALTAKELGGIDVLINNAGIGIESSMLELSLVDFDRVIAVNLRGTFICSRQAAKRMKTQGRGVILNIASTRGLMSEPNTEAYSASKGGILALTHAMAISLGSYGIRVNAISPGWIDTSDWQHPQRTTPPQHSEQDRLQHPVGRIGTPEDIAYACVYLADPKAGFITGQNMIIDGGMTVKMIYE